MAIGIHSYILFEYKMEHVDSRKWFLFLKCKLYDHISALVKVYFLSQGQPKYLTTLLDHLKDFMEGLVVFGGDPNMVLYPQLDASSGRSSLDLLDSEAELNRMKTALTSLHLINVWRSLQQWLEDLVQNS